MITKSKQKLRARTTAIKLERGCEACGYRKCAAALDFDHKSQDAKHEKVSKLVSDGAAWSRIAAEIAKCRVLCRNCHAEKTFARRDNLYSYRREYEEATA